jgi:hypothetical protein
LTEIKAGLKGACEFSVRDQKGADHERFDIFSRLTNRADLMDDMMDKLGVAMRCIRCPTMPACLRRAANRCVTCEKPDSCQQWLNTEIKSGRSALFLQEP